ncbi:hypothetical protein [Bdellovibrio sp. HCB209]|uniref:hypothetical protein n=1 Tax=Bdellovibrio sp. HCB209 TaxID=3394354 RepID=UPI0039B4C759
MIKTTSLLLALIMTASLAEAQTTRARKRVPAQTETAVTENTGATESGENSDTPVVEDPNAPSMEYNTDAASADSTETVTTPDGNTTLRPRAKRLPKTSVSSWAAGIQSLQWNEPLNVSQLGTTTKSHLNFNGIGLVLQKETYYLQWGWNIGGMLGIGRANGGPLPDGTPIERQSWNMFAITPRLFWRITNSVNVGGTAMVYMRNIDLPTESGTDITAGRKTNASFMADMSLRIFKEWDFYQAIGTAGDNMTIWKIGVNYRY